MDRLRRIASYGVLALLIASMGLSLGCRGMKSEIPPGRTYSTTVAPTPNVGFSSDPRPDAAGPSGLYGGIQQASGASAPGNPPSDVQRTSGDGLQGQNGGSPPQYGTPVGNKNSYTDALPTGGHYGPPGTTGLPTSKDHAQAIPLPATSTTDSQTPASPLQGALGVDLP